MKQNKNLPGKQTLATLIRRKITIRILLCFFILVVVLSTLAIYDVSNIFKQITNNLNEISETLGEFIVSQSLIQNKKSIDLTTEKASKDNNVDIKWREDLAGKGEHIYWNPLFSWKYIYFINSVDDKNFGAIVIKGSLLKNDIFVKEVLFSLSLLLFALIIIFSVLLPLANKIPNDLFLRPVMNLLNFLKNNQQYSIQDIKNTGNSHELNEITDAVSSLIEQVKQNAELQALGNIAMQVAHDIRSPASAILMLTKEGIDLPEPQRISLHDAAHRIQDIANNLITRARSGHDNNENASNLFLVSTAILCVISEKKLEYKYSQITISHQFCPTTVFSFINANLTEFKRVISNLLNNSIQSIKKSGKILVKLSSNDEPNLLKIEIQDTGCGMPKDLVNTILQGQKVSNKIDGLGLGFIHARKFLIASKGQLNISSILQRGTCISLTFPNEKTPPWIINEIMIYPDSIIVILDDDPSIHGAWDSLFSISLKKNFFLRVIHFTQSNECLEYIRNINSADHHKILLLTDYELLKQGINGLEVIGLTCLNRAILVTSHYENQDIIKKSILLNTKILPKTLASEVKLTVIENRAFEKKAAQLVVLEDDKEFSDILSYLFRHREKEVDIYNNSYDLLNNLEYYEASTIKICLDFSLGQPINGIELANAIYTRGFKNLYLASGYNFTQEELPSYLQVVADKMDILKL